MKHSDRESLAPGRDALDDRAFEQLRAFIFEHSGIYFPDNKRYVLEKRLNPRLEALMLPGVCEYVRYATDPAHRAEIPALISAVTHNESCFFRAPELVRTVVDHLLPAMISRGRTTIRIWSAGCAAGEEPYTLALACVETLLPRFPDAEVRIFGVDIDAQALTRARAGRYSAYALRHVPPNLIEKYFIPGPVSYRIHPRLQDMVSFVRLNLADRTEMMAMRNVDVVLCANVLIYFPAPTRERVLTSLYNGLNPGGCLLIGPSETLFGLGHPFRPIHAGRTVFYQKGERR